MPAQTLAIIDRHYAPGALRDLLLAHSRSVAGLAAEVARVHAPALDPDDIFAAAMLHDIGITCTDAPGIHCHGTLPYICHGIAGAAMLRADGVPEKFARVAERHTGAGITVQDIAAMHLPLPPGDYVPHSHLEQIVCYADKFFSKSGDLHQKPLARVIAGMQRHGADTAARFDALHRRWAIERTKN